MTAPTDTSPTFSERVVSRLSTGLFGRRSSRRSFLASTAVVGSALATKPWQYLVEPASAYDAVCGDGNLCSDGWTAFCCSVTGANLCPAGSFIGGWWKADASGFCCGNARYYIDCNALCGSSWIGHGYCNNTGTCDTRRVALNQFRYGQCHQEISCYGPVVCRVVTCTPPWQYDGSCTATSATDNRTVTHSAPCLPGGCEDGIVNLWYDLGGPGGVLGAQVKGESGDPTGRGTYAVFQNGAIYWSPPTNVHAVQGSIYAHYVAVGNNSGFLGFPVTNELPTPDGYGRFNHFEGGSIYWTAGTGAHFVHSGIRDVWAASGWERGPFGYPTSDELGAPDGSGTYNTFQGGTIAWNKAVGMVEAHGAIGARYNAMGSGASVLGLPSTGELPTPDGIGRFNHFQRGSIYWTPGAGAHDLEAAIRDKWASLGWERSFLGYPISNQATLPGGQFVHFQNGSIYWSSATGAQSVHGAIRDKWAATGWETGPLGYPSSDEVAALGGQGRLNGFEHGMIFWTPATGPHYVLFGPLFNSWSSGGREAGPLGYPISDSYTVNLVEQRVDFQHGSLLYNPVTGTVTQI